jgi:hypothetical protein
MDQQNDRRTFLGTVGAAAGGLTLLAESVHGQPKGKNQNASSTEMTAHRDVSIILGRAGDTSITANILSKEKVEGFIEYGTASGSLNQKSKVVAIPAGQPIEIELEGLEPNTQYFYRLNLRKSEGAKLFPESRFHTQRKPGSTFTFCVQGDSHPERPQMFDAALYTRTLQHAAACKPDMYICMGDDFSVNKIRSVSRENLTEPYLLQRPYLATVAKSASLYLVNGNHEQASLFNFNQKDERHEVAIGVQLARNKYYPMPAPGGIYTGDEKEFKEIGLLRDYFAWNWGDALFVVLDNYWHSPSQVDTGFQGGANGKKGGKDDKAGRNWWEMGLGNEQYHWFRKTLEQSKAKHKFVFAHHVMGTGRGGVEASEMYEWGGVSGMKGKGSNTEFKQKRPGWELPVHQLMAKHGVTIFFQGHDHLYARQEREGVVYQEVPIPADHTYTAFNDDAYKSGKKLPNAGYLKVTVSPGDVKVEYIRCWLPKDETAMQKTGDIAHSYTIKAKV